MELIWAIRMLGFALIWATVIVVFGTLLVMGIWNFADACKGAWVRMQTWRKS